MTNSAAIPNRSTESLVLGLSMFIMGGCGLAYEYTFSKIASDLLGNSAQQWAIIIGVMLFFMGIGSDLQKYLGDKRLLDKLIISEVLLGLLGALGPIAMLLTYGSFNSHYVLVQYFFICGVGLLIGFEIPLITRINQGYTEALKFNLGAILKMDYIGSLAGAMLWIFVLPKFFTTIESALVLGLITLGTALFALIYFRRLIETFNILLVVVVVVLFGLGWGLTQAKQWTVYAEQALYRDRIILTETSIYQHIVLTESASGELSLYINGHLQFNSSDEFIYHENLVHPAMQIAQVRKRILILGGGDGLALREVLKYEDVEEAVLVDLDPKITELARLNPALIELNNNSLGNAKTRVLDHQAMIRTGTETLLEPNQRHPFRGDAQETVEIAIYNLDAVKFLEQVEGRFDVIIMDFPDPNSPELAKLYSQQFYSLLKTKLSISGIMVQQSTSPVHAREAYLNIGRTWNSAGLSAIPYHDNVPSFGEWGWWIGGHDHSLPKASVESLLGSVSEIGVGTRYLTPELIKSSLLFGLNQLDTDETAISTLMDDRVYRYYLQGWENQF